MGMALAALPGSPRLALGNECESDRSPREDSNKINRNDDESAMHVQYLEIVTPEVDAICKTYSQVHDVKFGKADPVLGGACTAKMRNGGMLGVRAPLRPTEEPVVRPYVLVDDIEKAVAAAAAAGAEIALPPMELPGHGTCAIFIQGGIESGLWQL